MSFVKDKIVIFAQIIRQTNAKKKLRKVLLMALCAWSASMMQAETADSLALQEIVVTGTRNATDVRHLPMTVTVVGREKLTEQHQASVLPYS